MNFQEKCGCHTLPSGCRVFGVYECNQEKKDKEKQSRRNVRLDCYWSWMPGLHWHIMYGLQLV